VAGLFPDRAAPGFGATRIIGDMKTPTPSSISLALVLFALATSLSPSPSFAIEAGAAVPEVSAPRIGKAEETVKLSSFKGSVVYVDFWASWCVPCRISMPALDALYKKYGARGFVVLGVNKDATSADVERFLKRTPVTFTLVQDAQDAAAQAFDVKAMPSGYLVDRRGVVRSVHRGFTSETAAQVEHEIDELLKEPA
jgi:thiol-disulfide isomerase/thioredoxin